MFIPVFPAPLIIRIRINTLFKKANALCEQDAKSLTEIGFKPDARMDLSKTRVFHMLTKWGRIVKTEQDTYYYKRK